MFDNNIMRRKLEESQEIAKKSKKLRVIQKLFCPSDVFLRRSLDKVFNKRKSSAISNTSGPRYFETEPDISEYSNQKISPFKIASSQSSRPRPMLFFPAGFKNRLDSAVNSKTSTADQPESTFSESLKKVQIISRQHSGSHSSGKRQSPRILSARKPLDSLAKKSSLPYNNDLQVFLTKKKPKVTIIFS
jgi:hypothetical protein